MDGISVSLKEAVRGRFETQEDGGLAIGDLAAVFGFIK
jgi:hypothetical protein